MARLNVIFVSNLRDTNGLDLPAMLENSIRHSLSNSLHSMLLFSAGHLMQAIDGEAVETRCELQRIFASPHHLNSIVLNEETMQEPSLACTSLGALHLQPTLVARIPPAVVLFALTESAILQRVCPGIARNLLKQFACDYS